MKDFNLRMAMRAALLLLLMSAGVTKVFALENEFWVDDIHYYPYNSTTAWVTGCNAGMTTLNVPSTVTYNNNTYSVVKIYENAFLGNSTLTEVILPNSVTTISGSAFQNCTGLTNVVLPEGLTTLSSSAFQGCSNLQYFNKRVGNAYISTNELPSTLTTIYANTFYGCSSLRSIRIPSSITEIQGGAFGSCTNLEYVYVFGTTVPTLGNIVFDGTSNDLMIYVPAASVANYQAATNWSTYATHIEAMLAHEFLTYTFDTDNHSATVTGYLPSISGVLEIPVAYEGFFVTAIADNAFYDTNANTGCETITSVIFPSGITTIGEQAFRSCNHIASIDISQCTNLTEIGRCTFQSCGNLTEVKWNKAITTIGYCAFYGCGFTTLEIPNTVTSIDWYAFYQCNLVSLMLPKSVTQINCCAFAQNANLQDVYCYRSFPPTIDDAAFTNGDTFNCTLHVPHGCKTPYETHTGWEKFTNIVTMEPNTLLYSYEASNHTASVTGYAGYLSGEVTVPQTVTCNNETYTVSHIGDGAFRYGGNVTKITLPSTILSIGHYAFAECYGITTLTLPALTSTIGEYVFQGCTNLEEIIALEPVAPVVYEHSFDGLASIPCYVSAEAFNSFVNNSYWHSHFTIVYGALSYVTDDTNHTASLTGCSLNYIGAVTIPETFTSGGQSYSVVRINDHVFMNQPNITTISIPASVVNIGNDAFKNCQSLTAITVDAANANYKSDNGVLFNKAGTELVAYPCGKAGTAYSVPDGVAKIADQAFYGSNLTSIALPASVTTFGIYNVAHNAFEGATALTTITIDGNNANYKAIDGVLFNKSGTELIVCPEGKSGTYTIPAGVTAIDHFAFYHCEKLTSILLNGDLRALREAAFNSCTGLTSMVIPESITSIHTGAFSYCTNLQVLTCYSTSFPTSSGNPFLIGVNPDLTIYVRGDLLDTYQNSAYWKVFDLQAIAEPNANIQYSYDDTNLTATVTGLYDTSVTGAMNIPATVTYNSKVYTVTAIASSAFENCTGLTSVVIPHTVETIGTGAFHGCTGITELTIGRNVTAIYNYAFEACTGLETIHYYPVNCQTVGPYPIWKDCGNRAKTLDIKNCVQSIPNNAFYGLDGLGSVTIPTSVTTIGELAFAQCDMTSVSIGSNVSSIGYGAFSESTLTSVDLNNVATLGTGVFADCANLATVTLRNSQQVIPESCFQNCTSLTTIDIPSGTRTIGEQAFKGCTALTTLSTAGYASNLTTIGEKAFSGCTALTAVDIPNSVTTIGQYAFRECSSIANLTIGTGVESIGYAAFYYCSGLQTINYRATNCNTVSSSVWTGVGSNAKTLNIGTNVEVIPAIAFENLSGFTTVTLPNALTLIGYNAFKGCSLTEITIPNSVTEIESDAFMSCNLQTIVLGSGLDNIGSYAFAGNGNIATITSYNTTPPAVTANAFSNYNATLKVLAPAMTAYSEHEVWSQFTIESLDGYYFTGTTDSNWGTASNWSNGEVPTTETMEPNVVILADATVDITNAFANQLTIMDGAVVTVDEGKKLQIGDGGNGSFTATDASALVVEDGGSLINNLNENIAATIEKDITGHGGNAGKWYFVASPIVGANSYVENYETYHYTSPNNVENLFATPAANYDLYAFEQSAEGEEWQNFKQNTADFKLVDGNGYLYANHDDVTLQFAGDVRPSTDPFAIKPAFEQNTQTVYNDPENPEAGYYEQTENYPFTGWNLVGNPFACEAYIEDNYSVLSTGFYKMNAEGTAITAVESFSTAIPMGTGVFVKTSDSYDPSGGNSFSFTTNNPNPEYAVNHGSLQIALEQATMRGVSTSSATLDNAIVSFNEGSQLEKFVLFRDNARIYIPQSGKDYAIVSSETAGEMPINFEAVSNGSYTLSVSPNGTSMVYLHLIDNKTGADIDLLKTPSYTFDAKTTDYASRFRLVFGANAASGDACEPFAYFNGSNWTVSNPSTATLQVVDVMGRVLSSEQINGNAEVGINQPAGVYMLRLVNGDDVKVQKVVVK